MPSMIVPVPSQGMGDFAWVNDVNSRNWLTIDEALELNRKFVEYQKCFGEAQKLGKEILNQLAAQS